MYNEFGTIFRTTLKDQMRDRRSMGAAFLYALLGPVIMLLAFNGIAKTQDQSKAAKLAVYHADRAPELIQFLKKGGAVVELRGGDGEAYRAAKPEDLGGADAVLIVPADFSQRLEAQQPAMLSVLRDERSRASAASSAFIEKQVRDYGKRLAKERLAARGIDPDAAEPIGVTSVNISNTKGKALMAASMMLYFFILAPFFTSMTAAIDATAGERERQSLKPLLAQPVTAAGVIAGKWGVSATFGVVGTAVTVFLGIFLLRFAPLEKLGMNLSFDLGTQLAIVLVLIPLALFVAALQSLVAMLAKSFKEAQTYIQLLTLAPVGLLFMTSFSGEKTEGLALSMPLTGHANILSNLLSGEPIDMGKALIVSLISLLLTAVALQLSQKHLQHERLLGQL
jgi:sodium transport system permease protein